MISKNKKKLINKYISDAAKYLIDNSKDNMNTISKKMGISYVLLRQLVSNSKSGRNFTTSEIYQLAKVEQAPVSFIYPPIKKSKRNRLWYEEVTKDYSKSGFEEFLHKIN